MRSLISWRTKKKEKTLKKMCCIFVLKVCVCVCVRDMPGDRESEAEETLTVQEASPRQTQVSITAPPPLPHSTSSPRSKYEEPLSLCRQLHYPPRRGGPLNHFISPGEKAEQGRGREERTQRRPALSLSSLPSLSPLSSLSSLSPLSLSLDRKSTRLNSSH